jgi:dTDP-4-amino-4,6-dideoxy-D-galactose acyltransferase
MSGAAACDPCVRLAWDSEFFALNVARVNGTALDDVRAAAVDAWCAGKNIRCLYFLALAEDAAAARCAPRHGFSLVEVRMEFAWEGDARALPAGVREAVAADVPALEAIARSVFTDSRFYVDGHFPRAKCDDLYACWIRESCRPGGGGLADAVLVAEKEGTPAAFITCKRESGGVGRIGLVGVDGRWRGRGLGQKIVGAAQVWFRDHGVQSVRVVTQGRNIASQRLYQRCGFLTHAVGLYYHKWYP